MTTAVLSEEQIRLVREGFSRVAEIPDQTAAVFYQRLFTKAPSVKPMFSGDMSEQGRKLMMAIGLLVRGLDDLAKVRPVLLALGSRHTGYGVLDHHYDMVGAALIWTLQQGLGELFGEREQEAWTVLYGLVAATMREGAARTASVQAFAKSA